MYGSPQGISPFGAGTGAVDPLTLIQQPHTGLRVASWLFSLVILGCVVNEGYINRPDEVEQFCIFNRNQNACSLVVSLGSLAFVSCVLFLAVDACFPQISCVRHRKRAVLADLCTSAFWSLMWFVGFCFLANQWQESKPEDNPLLAGADAARVAIAFSFFSIFTWAGQRHKLGAGSALFSQDYTDPSLDEANEPYSSSESPAGTGGGFGGSEGNRRQEY